MSSMRVAAVQMNSQADVAKNLARASELVAEAASLGATLIGLPENFALMGQSDDDKRGAAESLDRPGPITTTLVDLAKKHSVWIFGGGMPERSDDPQRPYNTNVMVGPDGTIAARYRKIHLFDVDLPDGTSHRESASNRAGNELLVCEVAGVKVGLSVCYDLRFPELYRKMDARIIVVPAAFTLTTGKDHWHVLLRARAIENQVFVIAPAQHGKHPRGRQTYGKSLIVDPWGDVLAQAQEGESVCVATLDFDAQDRVRQALPCLAHRVL